jgi:hypothetical protein
MMLAYIFVLLILGLLIYILGFTLYHVLLDKPGGKSR